MRKALCGLVIGLVSSVVAYFYCSNCILLTVLVFSLLLAVILLKIVFPSDFISVLTETRRYFISKKVYKDRRKMSNSRKVSVSDRDDSTFDSGLLSNYDSRLSTGNAKSSKFMSPLRRFTKADSNKTDENFLSPRPFSPSSLPHSPANTSIGSSLISSPLSHSRRYNTNIDSRNDESGILGRRSLCAAYSPIGSPVLTPKRIPDGSNHGTPNFASRITATANEMGIDQFPWISPSAPIIPLVQSPLRNVSSPSQRFSLPYGDSNSPRRNRVRIKLAGPNRSETSLNDSSLETNSNIDDLSTTTKSVIKVLKEISRKRAYTPAEEDEEPPEAKRRPEHNLYLSRLEGDEENPLTNRSKGEEDRKRCRETEWDASNIEGPKRKRKLACINNEILSSLSSSIGLLQSTIVPVAKRIKRTVNVGTQVSLIQNSTDKKQNEQNAETNLTKTFKETGTMPDPPQPPRSRSPVKEKVVTNLNGILKSALSKFNIKPNEESKKIEETSSINGFSAKTDNIPKLPSTSSGVMIFGSSLGASSNNQTSQSLSLGIQPTLTAPATAFSFPISTTTSTASTTTTSISATTEASLNPIINTTNVSSSPIMANANQDLKEKKQEETKGNEICKIMPNSEPKQEISSLNASTTNAVMKSDSPFMLNGRISNASETKAETFVFKSSEMPTSILKSPTSTFTFGLPKTQEPSTVSSTSSGLALGTFSPPAFKSTTAFLPSTSNSASITVSSTTTTPSAFPQVAQSTASIFSSSLSSPPKSELFKFGTTGFGSNNKTTDEKVQVSDEKKENKSPFVFGKTENNTTLGNNPKQTETVTKSFQLGSKGFPIQQEDNKDKEPSSTPTNLFGQNTTLAPGTIEGTKPMFTAPDSDGKKDVKPGGFSFKLAQNTTRSEPKTIFSFGASASSQSVTTVLNTVTTTSLATSGASIFSSSLNNSNAAVSTSTTTVVTSAPASVSSGGATISFGQSKSAFESVSSASSTPIFGSVTSTFSSGNNSLFGTNKSLPTTSSSIFGSTATNNQTNTTSLFGSTVTNSGQLFGNSSGTNPSVPTFGNNVSGNTSQFVGTSTTAGNTTFGSSITSTAPTFGTSSATTPSFGSAVSISNTASGNNLFAGSLSLPSTTTPSFGSVGTSTFGSVATTNASIFGNSTASGTTAPAFGNSSVSGTAAPAFGSSTVSGTAAPAFGSSTVSGTAAPAFGNSTVSGTTAPAFGNSTVSGATAPAFGNSTASGTTAPAFGNSTVSGTTAPAFGNSTVSGTTAPIFGNSTVNGTTAPAFSNSTVSGTTAPTFGTTPSTNTTTFGSTGPIVSTFGSTGSTPAFGSASSTPSFGSTTTTTVPAFGSPQGFGSQQNTAFGSTSTFGQNASSTFGPQTTFGQGNTTSAFGSTSAFSTSTTPFNVTSNPTTSSFVTTGPAFGSSSTAFGTQEPNKLFGFNSSSIQPAPTGGAFNFSASQPQSSAGIFQFGTSSSTPSNQPFQFSAAQQNSAVGGTGQQMFSIGSGSTAPRRVTARRKK